MNCVVNARVNIALPDEVLCRIVREADVRHLSGRQEEYVVIQILILLCLFVFLVIDNFCVEFSPVLRNVPKIIFFMNAFIQVILKLFQ